MSGPKVISIVSREEVIENCEVLLARVDAEIAEWTRVGRRHSLISSTDEASVRESRNKLATLLATDQFVPLQKEAPQLIQSLRSDIDGRLERAENSRSASARQHRSLHLSALSVLRASQSAGIELPDDVLTPLIKATKGISEDIATLEQAVLKGVQLASKKPTATTSVSALSKQLSSEARTSLLDDWMGGGDKQQDVDVRFERAENFLRQLRVHDEEFSDESYQRRLDEIAIQEPTANRSLMLDTICLELKSVLSKASQMASIRRRLRELRAEAEASSAASQVRDLLAEADQCLLHNKHAEATELITKVEAVLNDIRTQKSGDMKRQALIKGLSEIGYHVNVEMSRVWTSQQPMIVRSSTDRTVGLELGGNLDAGRCQVRVVSLEGEGTAGPSKSGKDHEDQWCRALEALQAKLETSGASLKIEKATAAGTVPLKVVKGHWASDFEEGPRDSEQSGAEKKRAH